MKKWNAYGRVVGSKYLGIIEAETEKEALDKAAKQCSVCLCHQCSDECEDPEIDQITVEEEI